MPEIPPQQRALFDEQGHLAVGPLIPVEQVNRLRGAFEEQTAAWANNSSQLLAPRRNEKWEAHWSSA